MLTRKDYVRMAAALRLAKPRNGGDLSRLAAGMQWYACVNEIALALGDDNARFDLERFIAAAGGAA